MILRTARRDELDWALHLAADEGWNPGLDDADAFWAADPQGFFVAEVAGRAVAFISVVNHSDDHAFLGLYLCEAAHRGKGIGLALWTHALRHAGGRSVTLDGVAAQQANYAKSGFVHIGATQRWEGEVAALRHPAIRLAGAEDLPLLQALDTAANGHHRAAFLRAWTQPTPTRQTLVLADRSGFATARRCRTGVKVGPVVAPDAATAFQLVQAAASHLPGGPITLDLPEANRTLAGLLTKAGFQPGFTTARMVKGLPPEPTAALQAIATMELG
jgi:GNAT superfamily N-acetyltransferase